MESSFEKLTELGFVIGTNRTKPNSLAKPNVLLVTTTTDLQILNFVLWKWICLFSKGCKLNSFGKINSYMNQHFLSLLIPIKKFNLVEKNKQNKLVDLEFKIGCWHLMKEFKKVRKNSPLCTLQYLKPKCDNVKIS